jgi:pantetheine-phosphate adenylyltransferase
MTVALFAGRFDPVTNGHLDIALRAEALFDGLIVAVAEISSTLFSTEERVSLFEEAVREHPNIKVVAFKGLLVEFARSQGASILIRSVRGSTDFEYEFDMALMNRKMAPELESIYLISRQENLFISGTRIREVASLGYDVSDFVPAHVTKALKEKFALGNGTGMLSQQRDD